MPSRALWRARTQAGQRTLGARWLDDACDPWAFDFGFGFLVASAPGGADVQRDVAVAHDERRVVCIFGNIVGLAAEDLLDSSRYRRIDDVLAIRAREGCFSVLAIDREAKRAIAFGDRIGQRCWRYAQTACGTVIASHDLGIIATGALAPALDPTSLASIRSIGWSVGDASVFAGISSCGSDERLVIDGARVEVLEGLERFDGGGASERGSLAASATRYLDAALAGEASILVEMSAGFDSRAALATALEVAGASRIVGFSEGPEDCEDVQVAAEIARRAGLRFFRREPPMQTAEEFMSSARSITFETNGNIDGRVLASSLPQTDRHRPVTVCGDGGEIYRGFYYPYLPGARFLGRPELAPGEVLVDKLGLRDGDAEVAEVRARLRAIVGRLQARARRPIEVLDRFYAHERFGVWNQKLARAARNARRVSPFYSRRCAAALYQLPGPVGDRNDLHVELIRRGLPSCMDLPINGGASPRQRSRGLLPSLLGEAHELRAKVGRRIDAKLRRRRPSLEDAREARLQGIVAEVSRSLSPETLALAGVHEGVEAPPLVPFLRQLGALMLFEMAREIHAATRRGETSMRETAEAETVARARTVNA